MMLRRMFSRDHGYARVSILGVVYFVIGILVAVGYHYASGGISSISQIINFILAVIFWPLVLFLHVAFTFHVG